MKRLNLIASLLGAALVISLAGCGSDNRESSSPAQVVASQACIACHTGTTSHVTGNSVTTEWFRSAHSSSAGGAGCNDCHQVDGHPGNGAVPNLPNNGVCVTCHTATVSMSTATAHFARYSASYLGFPVSQVSRSLINPATNDPSASSCNGCHNPHDMTSLLPVNRQWAQSAHGAITDEAFDEQAFIKNTTCNRCHSGTGFRYYVTNGQTAITKAILGKYSSAREAVSCNACHTNYSWKRISTDPSVTTFVNFSTPYVRFPNIGKNFPSNVGDTKLCIPCHAGRSGSRSGAAITTDAATPPFDSHYFPAAAVMYGKIAFINFTSQGAVLPAVAAVPNTLGPISASTYGKTLITSDDLSGGVTSTHRKLGTTAINGDSHNPSFFVPGNLDSGGPCVVCHMTAGHTLQINADAYNKVCINCHTSERGAPLNASNFLSVFVDENREQMNDALALAVRLLEDPKYDISVRLADIEESQESSLIRKSTGVTLNTDSWPAWLAGPGASLTSTQIYKLKGAMYNILLCYKENASFVHARSLTRRVIYDTIDFLDNGKMDMSVGATAIAQSLQGTAATNPVFGKFTKGDKAFVTNTDGPLAPGTTSSMTYIIGFDRTFGTWTPAVRERP